MLLSQAEDRQIDAAERARLEMHLKLCEGCRHFQSQLGYLRRALRLHPALRQEQDDS